MTENAVSEIDEVLMPDMKLAAYAALCVIITILLIYKKKSRAVLGFFLLFSVTLPVVFITVTSSAAKTVLINEICSNNFSVLQNFSGGYTDYIELYNAGDFDISLEGWTLHTESELSEFYTFGSIVLEPGSYLLLVRDPSAGASVAAPPSVTVPAGKNATLAVPCAVSSLGETVYLRNAMRKTMDAVDVPALRYDTVYARAADADDSWNVFVPTPGSANLEQAVSVPGLFAHETVTPVYGKEELALPSDETADFPILSISIPEDSLYGTDGIFLPEQMLLTGRAYEKECRIDYFSPEKGYSFSQNAGIRVGRRSDRPEHLDFNLYARDIYDGNNTFLYDFWGTETPGDKVLLNYLNTKEHLILSLLRENGFPAAASMPCSVFINGGFYGKYYLSQDCDAEYIASSYGRKEENITLLEDGQLESGSDYARLEYQSMIDTASTVDLSSAQNYSRLCDRLDMESLLNYYAAALYFNNYDFSPYNECIVWRDEAGDKKWHFEISGLDTALTDFFTGNSVDSDTFSYALAKDPLLAALIRNDGFYDALYQKIAYISDNVCSEAAVETLLSENNYFSEDSEQLIADLKFFSETRGDFILSCLESNRE